MHQNNWKNLVIEAIIEESKADWISMGCLVGKLVELYTPFSDRLRMISSATIVAHEMITIHGFQIGRLTYLSDGKGCGFLPTTEDPYDAIISAIEERFGPTNDGLSTWFDRPLSRHQQETNSD